jgi:hypothetical protein
MFRESRKIHLIEEVLRVSDEATLSELETVLKKSKDRVVGKKSILDFVGVISVKEAKIMSKAIHETCEIGNDNDWK